MKQRLLAAFLTIVGVACITGETLADASVPLVAEFTVLRDVPISAAALKKMDDDFDVRRPGVVKRLAPAIAKTDEGYGARYRVRYRFKDGYADLYSGVFDGALREIHVTPRSFADAKRFARSLSSPALPIDFSAPIHQRSGAVTYQSKGEGCVSAVTLVPDGRGRIVEIDSGTAC